jgi:hypothetical protein
LTSHLILHHLLVGLTNVFVSKDSGSSYSSVPLVGTSQSVSFFGDGSAIAAVGTFAGPKANPIEGVAVSSDSGSTWNIIPVPIGDCRYGSFPSLVLTPTPTHPPPYLRPSPNL